ncbi:LysR family transcriptional regulator [Paenibacillus sp. WQ 127069]|jgi:DNA-binding transcriptional LysR family regulator|uniref:LysR family transcriptional regulator n=1 Tax=Paenibacillus baimaensis TaxID=2982185 RepID=A0ABT2UQT1_9BACL|nr:LysR family transcriptional regulator [Paenibacillus sp. WQ 127069]MCU6797018.1 LysR family transcriptional regulator [Paenibacillus sp. WQ 127069]
MNIENLEAFVYVIHFNSFNKAADALFLSQPSISARIQSLERELNALLFEREGKQFTLTDKGKQFLPYAQQILQSYKKGKQQLQHKSTSLDELRIGCTVSVANYLIPEILPVLKERMPDVQIKLTTAPSEALLDKLLSKEIDLGLVRNITHPHIHSVKFFDDPIRLFVRQEHAFARMESVTVEDVVNEPMVFFECGSLDWMKIHRLFESLHLPPNIVYHIDNLETAKKLVLKGVGISFLPELCVQKEVQEKLLVPIELPTLNSLSLRTNLISLNGEGLQWHSLFQDTVRGIQFKALC